MFPDLKDKVISYFKLIEKEQLVHYSDDIELIFIELPKFKKEKAEELKGISDKWIYFIKNAGSLEYIPDTLKKEEEIKEAFEIANTAGLSVEEEEEEIQFKKRDFIMLQKGSIDLALKQGMEKGMEKALKRLIESGMEEEKAKNILGLP